MKKILILSLVALSFLLVSCTQGTIVGKAYDPADPDSFRTELCTLLEDGCGPAGTDSIGTGPTPPIIRMECRTLGWTPSYGSLTGHEYCQTFDFETCIGAEFSNATTYYTSTDGSCREAQLRNEDRALSSCDTLLQSSSNPCNAGGSGYARDAEPAFGDYKFGRDPHVVTCCRLVGPIMPS